MSWIIVVGSDLDMISLHISYLGDTKYYSLINDGTLILHGHLIHVFFIIKNEETYYWDCSPAKEINAMDTQRSARYCISWLAYTVGELSKYGRWLQGVANTTSRSLLLVTMLAVKRIICFFFNVTNYFQLIVIYVYSIMSTFVVAVVLERTSIYEHSASIVFAVLCIKLIIKFYISFEKYVPGRLDLNAENLPIKLNCKKQNSNGFINVGTDTGPNQP